VRIARRLRWVVLGACLATTGCAMAPTVVGEAPLRIRDVADQGDDVRRASQRLVLEGLDADAQLETERARGLYQRALQVDSGNPFAYLALARHCVAQDEPELALEYVERAQDLFSAELPRPTGVDVHLEGLRGAALTETGETVDGNALLERAAETAPEVWGDGRLDADELR
jgi:tetratricopeptide (TPR) repeat protein